MRDHGRNEEARLAHPQLVSARELFHPVSAVTTVALIPARGGSKGIPRKNLRLLGGLPLISWSIRQALDCELIDEVIVSTDDPEIASTAISAGASVPFMRPAELADDHTSTEAVMLHSMEALESGGQVFDQVVLLQPTSPVRRRGSIARALIQFEGAGADSLVSLTETHPFVWRAAGEYFVPLYDPTSRPRRQDITEAERRFVENGSIYITSASALIGSRCRVSGRVVGFPMSPEEAIDIDEEVDFLIAATIMENLGLI